MSPQNQRIAIATACGLTNVKPAIVRNVKHQGDDITVGISSDSGWVPDYLNDLNACHEMEAWLKNDDRHAFSCYASDLFEEHGSDAVHLTAPQRCEAFLRTLGLWEEEAQDRVESDRWHAMFNAPFASEEEQ